MASTPAATNTQDAYNYVRRPRARHGCLVMHGSHTRPNRPIITTVPSKADIDWNGRRVDGGVMLWTVGTDVAKDHIFNRFKLTNGWGAMHFSAALDLPWFEGLLAERPTLKRKPGGGYRRVWAKFKESDRNEPLDLAVYNLALAHHLGIHKWTLHDWQRLREKLVPRQLTPDLFAQRLPEPAPQEPPPPHVPQAGPEASTPGEKPEAQPPPPPAPPAHPPAAPPVIAPQPAAARRTLSRGLSR